nr:hypothetical protein [Tanacetum cinerariifolium]
MNTRSTADQETINATSVTNAQLQAMIDQGVTVALAARDALRSTNGDDSHNSETGVRRTERANRECTYTDFIKCQPLPLKGTEGVASLSQWCERMESIFHISNCVAENQVKFATCTLHSVALTWWNTHIQTVGHEVAYDMTWKMLMKMMNEKYSDGRIIGLNTILMGCTLNLLNHPFNIDLMPVELGSFDAIIGMDWLAKYQAVIVCAEKIEVKDKSEKKRLEDVPIVRNFPEVFPEELPGLPSTRPVEFQIDLVPGAALRV